jgi:hypothetical protein
MARDWPSVADPAGIPRQLLDTPVSPNTPRYSGQIVRRWGLVLRGGGQGGSGAAEPEFES